LYHPEECIEKMSRNGIFYLFHVGRCVVLQVVKVLGVGVMVEVGLHGLKKNFVVGRLWWDRVVKVVGCRGDGGGRDPYRLQWDDAVHIGRGNLFFWRERGGEEQRDPAGKRIARRLMTRGGWRGYATVRHVM
jgi:hypothetical protein